MERQPSWTELRAIIRRSGGEYLIIRPTAAWPAQPGGPQPATLPAYTPAAADLWDFPGGRCAGPAPAEEQLRQHCRAKLGVDLDTLAAQPAFEYAYGTHSVRYLVFTAAVQRDYAVPLGYAELRWVRANQLSEYAFVPALVHLVAQLSDLRSRSGQ